MSEFLVEVLTKFKQSRTQIPLQLRRSQPLGDGTRGLPPPKLQLKHAVRSGDVALSKKEIMLIFSVNVRYPPLVPNDLHGLL